jgi:hypothetical protein
MQRVWPEDELVARWSLAPKDLALVRGMADSGKLGLSAQLAFWRQHGRFPDDEADLAPMVLAHLAAQVGVAAGVLEGYEWAGRTGRRHRRMVLDHLAVAAFDTDAEAILRRWLTDEVLPREQRPAAMEEEISAWFAHSRIVRPGAYRLDRIVRSTRVAYDDAALQSVADRLDPETRERLNALLSDSGEGAAFTRLATDPGRVGLESLFAEITKLDLLRTLGLPRDVLRGLHPDQINRFHRRAAIETAWELRRHPERIRLPLLAFYCVPREGEVVDGLVELLIQVTHRITVKAERRVIEELVAEAQQVRGKAGILVRVAEAAVGQPDGVVREVIFPVAGEQTFEALAREAKALGTPQSRRIHTVVRASYGSYYRRMMPKSLAALDFCSNNGAHRPLLDALTTIRRAEGDGRQYFSADEIAIEDVVRPKWRDIVIEDAPSGGKRVNRINYEICVLQTLRERLRCKEVWVAGANRFRNPDYDLPADFAARRAACYEKLGLPTNPRAFKDRLKVEMTEALVHLNKEMPRNSGVRLDPRRRHPIVVSPLEPQPEPPNLDALKGELGRRWPMTGLLDILKETDLRVGFTEAFSTAAAREATDRDEVRRRLLLCLYGLGTNAGLKRLAVGRTVSPTRNCCILGGTTSMPRPCAMPPGAWSTRRWLCVTLGFGAKARPLARQTPSISAHVKRDLRITTAFCTSRRRASTRLFETAQLGAGRPFHLRRGVNRVSKRRRKMRRVPEGEELHPSERGSPPTSPTAARASMLRKWLLTRARERLGSTTAPKSGSG